MGADEGVGYNGACIRYNFTKSSGVNPPLSAGEIAVVLGELLAPEETEFLLFLLEWVGREEVVDAEPSPCPPCMRACIIR